MVTKVPEERPPFMRDSVCRKLKIDGDWFLGIISVSLEAILVLLWLHCIFGRCPVRITVRLLTILTKILMVILSLSGIILEYYHQVGQSISLKFLHIYLSWSSHFILYKVETSKQKWLVHPWYCRDLKIIQFCNQLIPWSRILLEKLIVAQLLK
jgi:hypothetical protein